MKEKNNNGYIYCFYDVNGICLYVGKTIDIKQRFQQHKEKEWWKEVYSIECAEVKDLRMIDIYERYYINKLKGKYNIKDNKIKYIEFHFPELKFEIYL
jgi:excinuclease UvrABC nuclease subunit